MNKFICFMSKMSDYLVIKQKEECGASFISRNGKDIFIGNACFFCCLWFELIKTNPVFLILKYEDFLDFAKLPEDFAGKMIDTYEHAENLRKLANHFEITIHIYTEIIPGIVHSSIMNRFGYTGKIINIVKLYEKPHFNLIKSFDDNKISDTEKLKAESKLKFQIEKDFKIALDLQEDYNKIENQISEDQKLALSLNGMSF
jgi:hypothetical protein